MPLLTLVLVVVLVRCEGNEAVNGRTQDAHDHSARCRSST